MDDDLRARGREPAKKGTTNSVPNIIQKIKNITDVDITCHTSLNLMKKEDKLKHRLFKAVCLCNYPDNCSIFYNAMNAFQPFIARCTQTDFFSSNYAFGIIKQKGLLLVF